MSMKKAAETGAKVMNGRTFPADDIGFAIAASATGDRGRRARPSRVARGGAFEHAADQTIVPLQIGWNAVTASRTAWVERPVFGRIVVKLACSPCSAM